MAALALHVGDRLWFAEEKRPYTIQAISVDGVWVICTKIFAAQGTVLYTVIDCESEVRGTDNMIGSLGYETQQECERAAREFGKGHVEHSRRPQPIQLNIVKWEKAR